MAFLDEEDPLAPVATEPGRGQGPPSDRQRQFMVRRMVAVGIGLLVIILLVLAVRGCLNARKERAFENYVSDLSALVADSRNLSEEFFGLLEDPGNRTALQFEAEVKATRGAAEGLVDRAEGLDTPDEVDEHQGRVILAFEQVRDGLTVISDQIGAALGKEGRSEATREITLQMQNFLAADVLYRQARDGINAVLVDEGIAGKAPQSQFLPDLEWLEETRVSDALAGVSGAGAAATPGIHGMGLIQTTLLPTGVVLQEGAPATASADGGELEVQVQNQGESEETDVIVTFEITGGGETISGDQTIPRIAAQEIQTVAIPIQPQPSPGSTVTILVRVEPVAGEEVEDNNEAEYQVTFE